MTERLWREGVRNGLMCDVCRAPYQAGKHDPITLPCGHTFCRACLERLVGLSCPTCRAQHHGRRVSMLPPNYALLTLLDTFKNTVQDEKCPRHKNQLMSYWCRKCEKLVCGLCIRHTHNKNPHTIIPEAVARWEKRKAVEEKMEEMERKVEEIIMERERAAVYQLLQDVLKVGALMEVRETLENIAKVLKSAPAMDMLLSCEGTLRDLSISASHSSQLIHQEPQQDCASTACMSVCVSALSSSSERQNETNPQNPSSSYSSESRNKVFVSADGRAAENPSSSPTYSKSDHTPQNPASSLCLESRNEFPSQKIRSNYSQNENQSSSHGGELCNRENGLENSTQVSYPSSGAQSRNGTPNQNSGAVSSPESTFGTPQNYNLCSSGSEGRNGTPIQNSESKFETHQKYSASYNPDIRNDTPQNYNLSLPSCGECEDGTPSQNYSASSNMDDRNGTPQNHGASSNLDGKNGTQTQNCGAFSNPDSRNGTPMNSSLSCSVATSRNGIPQNSGTSYNSESRNRIPNQNIGTSYDLDTRNGTPRNCNGSPDSESRNGISQNTGALCSLETKNQTPSPLSQNSSTSSSGPANPGTQKVTLADRKVTLTEQKVTPAEQKVTLAEQNVTLAEQKVPPKVILAEHFPEARSRFQSLLKMRCHVRYGKELWGRVKGEDGKVLLYTFSCYIPDPSHFSLSWHVLASSLCMDNCLTFLNLALDGKNLGRVVIRLWTHLKRARHFLGLCLGLWGASFKHTSFQRVQETEFCQFLVSQGHHSEMTGKLGTEGFMSDLEWDGEFAGSDRVGQLVSFGGGHSHLDAVFGICTTEKKIGGRSRCPFAEVVEGMDLVHKAAANVYTSLVNISTCGLVLAAG